MCPFILYSRTNNIRIVNKMFAKIEYLGEKLVNTKIVYKITAKLPIQSSIHIDE